MPTFKNTLDIITNPWNKAFSNNNSTARMLPSYKKWDEDRNPQVEDIILWEQLYYEAGNLGIYAAFNPYVDCYLITYNLFFDTNYKFEIFYGNNSAQKCYDRAVELGISLDFI
jgi:hypothetical protein